MPFRGTQQAAFDAVVQSFRNGDESTLLVAATGWGKTYFISELFRYSVEKWGINCLFLVHTKELAKQTHEAIPDSALMCSGLGKNDVGKITIATKQTLVNNLDKFKNEINFICIDECHYMRDGDQYHDIINHFSHGRLRVLGLTATPFRTSEGFIYGEDKFFKEVAHQTTLDQMIELGFLSPYRYKVVEKMKELDNLELSKGEFKESDLEEILTEELHMGSVKKAIDDHCEGRESIMIFCVTIDHAEALAEFLGCKCVHSKLDKKEWRARVDDFKSGKDRMLVNVAQLSVGFNHPAVDALVQARPTMSPALFTQICGRAFRIAEGKKDALILDMVGNYGRHGLPSNPKVRKPKEKQEEREKKELESNVCHECFEIVEGGLLICPCCGADLVEKKEFIEIDKRMKLKEIETQRKKPKFIKHWHKSHLTKKGNHGVMFCVKVTGRDKPLFKFCGANTKKIQKTIEKVDSLVAGQVVDIVSTPYGDWIA